MLNVRDSLLSCSAVTWFNIALGGEAEDPDGPWSLPLVLEVHRQLKRLRILDTKGYTLLADCVSDKSTNEDEAYKTLQSIALQIARIATDAKPELKGQQTAALQSSGTKPGQRDAPGHIWKPDARFILLAYNLPKKWADGTVHVRRQPTEREWRTKMAQGQLISILDAHCVCVGEFKKASSTTDQVGNERQTVSGATFTLYNDPRRRFVYAFSIEKELTRLWRFDRGSVIVSNSFDCHKSPLFLIRFFLFIMFANAEKLGIDQSIERWEAASQEPCFIYRVGGRRFRTKGRPLYDAGAAVVISRGVRAWVVVELDDCNNEIGEEMVLKDYWAFEDLPSEKEIQDNILHRLDLLDKADVKAGIPQPEGTRRERMARFFLTIVLEEDVRLEDGSVDKTQPKPPQAEQVRFTQSQRPSSNEDPLQTQSQRDPTRSTAPAEEAGLKLQHHTKVHRRVIYKEHCQTFYEQDNLQHALEVAAQLVSALDLLRQAGYMHRDISGGNCLVYSSNGTYLAKLTDLEYCKPYWSFSVHDPITATREFLAVEPFREKLLHKVTTVLGVFYYHPWHDLEALYWLILYFIFAHLPIKNVPDFKVHARAWHAELCKLFNPTECQERIDVLRNAATTLTRAMVGRKQWPPETIKHLIPVLQFAGVLTENYTSLQKVPQKQHPSVPAIRRWPRRMFTGEMYSQLRNHLRAAASFVKDSPSVRLTSAWEVLDPSKSTSSESARSDGSPDPHPLGNWPQPVDPSQAVPPPWMVGEVGWSSVESASEVPIEDEPNAEDCLHDHVHSSDLGRDGLLVTNGDTDWDLDLEGWDDVVVNDDDWFLFQEVGLGVQLGEVQSSNIERRFVLDTDEPWRKAMSPNDESADSGMAAAASGSQVKRSRAPTTTDTTSRDSQKRKVRKT